MQIRSDLENWAKGAAWWWENQGAEKGSALQLARLYAYSWADGIAPRVTSVFRDPAKQQAMREDWDAGRRTGLRARPADPETSKHCLTGWFGKPASRATDMPSNSDPRAAQIARWLGLGTGENFASPDPGHYYV